MMQAEHPGIGEYVSKLRSQETFPWADWITKHLIDTYGTMRGVGPTRVKEMDLLQIKENLRYACLCFGDDCLLRRLTYWIAILFCFRALNPTWKALSLRPRWFEGYVARG